MAGGSNQTCVVNVIPDLCIVPIILCITRLLRMLFFNNCKKVWSQVGPGDVSCSPLIVSDVPGAGRGLTAARAVERGELILSVSPLATGGSYHTLQAFATFSISTYSVGPLYNPHYKRSHSLQCVQCYKHLQKPHHCQRCRLPVCSSTCSRGDHHRVECQILSNIKTGDVKSDEYRNLLMPLVVVLRLLSLKWR